MERVVVTGMGILSPIGIGISRFFEALIAGQNGVGPFRSIEYKDTDYNLAGEVLDFEPRRILNDEQISNMGRSSQFAIAATQEAFEDAGLLNADIAPSKIGVSMGTTMGEGPTLIQCNRIWLEQGPKAVPSELLQQYPCSVVPANVARHFNLCGPNIMIPTACASGNYAIGYAFDLIRMGKATVMAAGGSDSINPIVHQGFLRIKSLTNDFVRPFDKNRKGIVTSEGCAMLVLESYSSALNRKARIHAEILGYGLSCPAHHMTVPHPDGLGAQRAMQKALNNSGIPYECIDYVSAHGTGTPTNDRAETIALKGVFGQKAYDIPVSSIKSMMGHTMGAASAIEAVSCILAINNNVIPPTINYEEKDPDCDLDYVPNTARRHNVSYAMSNAYAFGGNDSSLILGNVRN